MRARLAQVSRGTWAAIASGLLFALAFPPVPLVVPGFVCLVPLAVAVAQVADRGERARQAARLGFWFGIVGCGLNLYWIAIALSFFTWLASLGYVATILGWGIIAAGATTALYAMRRLTRWPLAILLPAAWITFELALEYLGDLAFPWLPLGLAVARTSVAAQVADLSGVHGVSVWIAATNGLLADAWLLRAQRRAVMARVMAVIVLAVAVCGYGVWRLQSTVLVPVARVGIVQPNIPEDEKMQQALHKRFIGILAQATREEIVRDTPDLVVWPETALPGYISDEPSWQDSLRVLAGIHRTPVLFGVLEYEVRGDGPQDYDYFNAAMLADTAGRLGTQPTYRKHYLVPIVERVPFVNPRWFAGLKYFGGFGRGTNPWPFQLPFGRVGVLICYESIFPDLARTYRRRGADLLLNITNDAWFGRTTAPYQHESHLRLRAIENRVGVVRSANTGISEYIDPLGGAHGATGLFVPASSTYHAQTTHDLTLYTAWGDWLGLACVGLTVILLVACVFIPFPSRPTA